MVCYDVKACERLEGAGMGHDVRPRPRHGERNKRDRRRQPRGGEGSSGR